MNELAPAKNPTWMTWTGRVLSVLVSLLMLLSAYFKLFPPPDMEKNLEPIGWKLQQMGRLGMVEIVCVILYLIPQTSVLGAILFTGYMGGAIATHYRIDQPVYAQIAIGVMVWLGLFLREPRLRAILPLRK